MNKASINWTNMLLFSLTPVFAMILVPLYGYFYGYDLYEWLVFIGLMGFCGMSITAGYHRLWSHKTYKAHPILRAIFAIGGACALQNDVLHWASDHRRHHQHVDNNDLDPYSAKRGFWFSHIGWLLRDYASGAEDFSNVGDLKKDPIVMWQHRHYLGLILITNIALPAILGFIHGDIIACLLLAGLLRLVLSQHLTYLINSLAHIWGQQPYCRASSARDNPILALITYGEGYHNYHHAFQWDYRNGVKWWHYDPTKWMIRICSLVGLTRDLKRSSFAQIEKAKLEVEPLEAAGVELIFLEDVRENISGPSKLCSLLHHKFNPWAGQYTPFTDTAVVLYTSGSEGVPKGVELTHKNLLANVRQGAAVLDMKDTDRFFTCLQQSFK